jgi:hypothetical protein
VRGKKQPIETRLDRGTTFFFAKLAIMPIIKREIIAVGVLNVGIPVTIYNRIKLCTCLSEFPHSESNEMLPQRGVIVAENRFKVGIFLGIIIGIEYGREIFPHIDIYFGRVACVILATYIDIDVAVDACYPALRGILPNIPIIDILRL